MKPILTTLFLVSGGLSALLAHFLYDFDLKPLTIIVSLALLLPGVGLAWWIASERGWIPEQLSRDRLLWISAAAPFPYTLITLIYGSRRYWLPEAWQEYLNNPTAYLLFTTGLLAVSLAWTSRALARALPPHPETPGAFRALSLLLFVLMGVAASLGDPIWIGDLFRYVLEPLGTVLFATVFGWRLGQGSAHPRGQLGLS